MTDKIILPEIIERTINSIFEDRKQSLRYGVAVVGECGDSPIEWAMSIALEYAECLGMGENKINTTDDWSTYFKDPSFDGTIIFPQAKVGKYRADFMIVTGGQGISVAVAVECDGHDYHERTKEQARHDKSRDRFFIEQGITVLRFAGSEIYANANTCADQALTTARSLWFDRFSLREGGK